MTVYLWLEYINVMLSFHTVEDLHDLIGCSDNLWDIRNSEGFKIMIERNTKMWRN